MTEPDSWKDELKPSTVHHVEHIVGAFRNSDDGGKELNVVVADGLVGHIHAEGEILVREEYLGRVLEILHPGVPDLERDQPERFRRVIAGVVLLALDEPQATVAEALDLIDQRLGRGVATPNHVLTVSPEVGGCPATEPQEVYYGIEPYPSVCPGNGGAGVLIYLADTGLLADAATHSWLAGVRVGDPAEDEDRLGPPEGNTPTIPPYAGHGTFVAGLMRCMAPAADVIVANAFSIAGSHLESDLIPRLELALGLGADIFHLNIASPSRYDLPLVAFREWLRHLRQYSGAVCVAPAGNEDSRRPSWPAAFPEVVSVGALGGDWRGRASFSSYGGWVDVYAPGRDLVNAYATGMYKCRVAPYKDDDRSFYGMAKWSGTSFSAPIVTGLIAARMSRTGENGRQAAAALLAEARSRAIPGLGAILLPPCSDHETCGKPPESCCRRTITATTPADALASRGPV
jgi:Subtilase family